MPVNLDKPHLWKDDIRQSVDMYNNWFLQFAPSTYRTVRVKTTEDVQRTLNITENLTKITASVLMENPQILPTLRMAACPPIAVDRLIGLADVSSTLVKTMEEGKIPPRMAEGSRLADLEKIGKLIERLADPDIFVWLEKQKNPDYTGPLENEVYRAATIVADRLCGSQANPIIRNAQEQRQLATLKAWLESKGYTEQTNRSGLDFSKLKPGTFAFRLNVSVKSEGSDRAVNIPIDAIVMPKNAQEGDLPLLIEAKSAGDFTNVNKRRKEEAQKASQLRSTYTKEKVRFILLLCGYFDGGYLGYEASEGIDWVWEHRLDDLIGFGL